MSAISHMKSKTTFSIHPATGIASVSMTVADLDKQVDYYHRALGFTLQWRDGNRAGLGEPMNGNCCIW